ncbi:hypothetical protein P22_2301 [Propionispora sp. 2/2-37]|uniref:metal ABC transporter ATP-binding protein n=1 Tax=Propionispora sp. 2/2-37 TaxID=1677858 RepID=UPI0006BB94C6|nr:metal ABC transporter ATP-binding protein [Propionispora sp. 2/2-37]CUH96212.1 hypothetical protein P22_2301 [Propionispora sp. 2/2-37]
MNGVKVNHISFSYGSNPVLEDITMTVEDGEFLAVFGPNGAGKSTLLKIIAGVLLPDKGKIEVCERELLKARRNGMISYVPQNYGKNTSDFPITVAEVVALGLVSGKYSYGYRKKVSQHIIEHMLELVQAADLRDRRIGELSGGQQQRVMVAMALAKNPKLLLLDEPTSGIDYAASHRIYELLGTLNKNLGITVIMISHDIKNAAVWATSVACINRGLCFRGNSEEFRITHEQGRHLWY